MKDRKDPQTASVGIGSSKLAATSKQTGQLPTGSDDFGYQRGQRRRMKKRLGTCEQPGDEGAAGFSGGERRVWLYIYRVNRQTTSEMIENYIRSKPDFGDVPVKARELPTDEGRLKCFVVVAPLTYKDTMYKSNFWPVNVGIRRFDFERHRDFLQENRDFLQ